MTVPPLWLSGPAECQDFSDDCLKVLKISSAAAVQAARSIQTVREGTASSLEPGEGTASPYDCAAPPPPQHLQGPGPTQPRRKGQQQHMPERTVKRHQVSGQSSLSGVSCTQPELTFQSVRDIFFPLLTIKANIKTFISPSEPTSPEIVVLRQIQDALVCLYGFKAVKEASWLSRIRNRSHRGFSNPFY